MKPSGCPIQEGNTVNIMMEYPNTDPKLVYCRANTKIAELELFTNMHTIRNALLEAHQDIKECQHRNVYGSFSK